MTQTQHGSVRTAPSADGQGLDELADRYARDGYVVLPGAFTAAEVAELRAEALRVCRGERGAVAGMEPGPPGEPDETVIRRYACVHFPHKLSPPMRHTLAHPVVVAALIQVIGPDVKAMQSMLFTKGEGKPGQAWHQDEFFIPTRDRSLTAAWIALDDATTENGCLWVLPGSHRPGVIYPDRDQDDPRFDCTVEAYSFPYQDADAVPVQIAAGSVLLFNGYLLHRSLPNTARSGLRRALVNHYMSARSLLPWTRPPDDVHVAKWDYRDIVMVVGHDPYAWRGITDVSRPSIRPDKDGGCHR
jgi:ectoine hydroxylase-related dioxygenase (phytanoyl-CoA dioxygenase family)